MSPSVRPSLVVLVALVLVAVLAPGASGASSRPTTENLLQNPGFEAGLASWSVYDGEATLASTVVHSGGSSARLGRAIAQGRAELRQTVPVTPLASYRASAFIYLARAGVTFPQIQVAWQNSAGAVTGAAELQDCAAGAWCLLSAAGQAPAGAVSAVIQVRVYVWEAPSHAYIDDAEFVQTAPPPAPTSTATVTPTRTRTPSATLTRPPVATSTVTRTPTVSQTPTETATATVTATPTETPQPPVVVINELEYYCRHDGVEADFEWVELYNASSTAVSLDGWTLRDNYGSVKLPPRTLDARAFVVVVVRRSAFMTNYPQFAGELVELGSPIGNGLANSGDRLILSDASGQRVDALSYGDDTSVFNPAIAGVKERGRSLERRPAGYDTDQASDFQEQIQPSPGQGWPAPTATATPTATASATASPTASETPTATASATVSPTASLTPIATASATASPTATETQTPTATLTAAPTRPASVVYLPLLLHEATPTPTPTATPDPRLVTLNEFLPAPDSIDWNGDGQVNSGDEWIELYNGASVPVDLSGWALDDEEEGSKIYFLPAGTVISAHGFLLLFGSQTGLSLANTKDSVRLFYRNGELLEEFAYYATWKDRSFSKTVDGGATWTYWYPPSPGKPNRP